MYENHNFIKQTMLKHEDTFRHQVRELHRLYYVQKNLMAGDLRNDAGRQNIEFSPRATNLDTNNNRIVSGFDILRPVEEGMSCGANINSGIRDDRVEPHDVELTLSIGPAGTSKRRTQNCNRHHQMGGNDDSKVLIKPNLMNSSTLYNHQQDSKRPHWLFQDLSLNRT